MLDKFLKQGYVLLNDKEAFKFIDLNEVKWTDAGDVGLQIVIKEPLIQKQLLDTREYLGEKYVKQIDVNYKSSDKIDLVNGMDKATLVWHNDMIKRGPNFCILAYFDTMDNDIGGAICFRKTLNKKQLIEHYPKPYDLIIMNQSIKFEHKVNPLKLKLPRRVASFHYYVNERI